MMMSILRDQKSGICMCGGGFRSNGSQVSVIQRENSRKHDVHYFTGTPNPSKSCYKPLSFPCGKTETMAAVGDAYTSNGNEVPLEKINYIAAELWDNGDRRNGARVAERINELERTGLEYGEKVGGARVYLELAQKELNL